MKAQSPDPGKNTGLDKNRDTFTLFLGGDVMTGRGIDQVLPHSVPSILHENYVKNARAYIELAERKHGPIPDKISYDYLWGEAQQEFKKHQPDVRIINLETAVTTSNDYWKGKGIHYRMDPQNIPILEWAQIDACILANNHVLDWGYPGLRETLSTLKKAGIQTVGAGLDERSAAVPAVIKTESGRLLLFSYCSTSAGVPKEWRARKDKPGVNFLDRLNAENAEKIIGAISAYKQAGDRVLVSLHWGGNWGYDVSKTHRAVAHQLIDSGIVDVIHGHSSHHPKGIELYKDRPIFYGCGDLINDYEGIGGYEKYRDDLVLLYFLRLDTTGALLSLEMSPMQICRFQLRKASAEDVDWLQNMLDRECRKFGNSVRQTSEQRLAFSF